jgi:ABC-type thiamine transport system substrate-binding protein
MRRHTAAPHPRLNRMRTFIAGLLTLLWMFALPAQAQTRTLVVSGFGLNADLLKKHLYAPFEARCQCKVVLESGTAADRLAKLDARKANPVVDVFQAADFIALEASGKGLLQPLDQIVMVAVTSAHRGESFQACEFLMDYLKTQAPFWKKEQTPDGARWVDARVSDDAALAKWGITSSNA